MKKVSIVVPVYNVEKYLAKCLDSCLNQTFDDYDIIVLNDGSPYGEQAIIDEYATKYPDKIIAVNKENGGYGSNLQMAFELSRAENVLVCDSDDYLDKDCLKILVETSEKTGADIVIGAKNLVYSDNEEIKYDKSYNEEFGILESGKCYNNQDKESDALYFVEPSPHSKLYKREVVKKIKFPIKTSYTDNLLYFYALQNAEKVCYIKEALSYYLIDRTGNTRTDVKPKVVDDFLKVYLELMKQVDDKDDIFLYRMFEGFMSIFYKVETIKGTKEEKRDKYHEIYKLLKQLIPYSREILNKYQIYGKDNQQVTKQKIALLNPNKAEKVYACMVSNKLDNNLFNKIKLRLLA